MKKSSIEVALSLVLVATVARAAAAETYHISATTGSDATGAGTEAKPWKSFAKATPALGPGDTLIVGGGTYAEQVVVKVTGATAAAPVLIQAAAGAKPLIAGGKTLPVAVDQGLVDLTGDHITFEGFEVADSTAYGIAAHQGTGVLVKGNTVHGTERYAIRYYAAKGGRIDGNDVYDNVRANAKLIGLGAGCVLVQACDGVVLENNTIHENFGFGISIVEGENITARGNTLYDNVAYNISNINTKDVTLTGNFAYCTGAAAFNEEGVVPAGISLEGIVSSGGSAPTIKILNNIVSGCVQGIIWNKLEGADGMENTLIANNTFVGLLNEAIFLDEATVHTNSVIANNIFSNNSGDPLVEPGTGTGMIYANNGWAGPVPTGCNGPGDVLGTCPLVNANATDPSGYKLVNQPGGTVCHDAGKTLAEVTTDFFGTARPVHLAYDIGAHEAPQAPPPLPDVGVPDGSSLDGGAPAADADPGEDAGVVADVGVASDGGSDAGTTARDGGGDAGQIDDGDDGGGCGCALDAEGQASEGALLLCGLLLLLIARPRRRR